MELIEAAKRGNIEELTRLLDSGIDVDTFDENQTTALEWACIKNRTNVIQLLLARDADTTRVNRWNINSLHYVCENDNVEAALLLFEHGANIHDTTNNGETPLHWSCEDGSINATKLLLEHGADIHAVNTDGRTSFHCCCIHGHLETAKILLEHRADTTRIDNDGRTALSYLKPQHLQDIEAYIQELEQQREQERLYAMIVLEQQRSRYFAVADIGSIVTTFLR